MTTDRAALEKAITRLREDRMADTAELNRVISAAQAWADTLPRTKMVWVVRTPSGSSEHDSIYLAAENLKVRLVSGAPSGEIERREVPV